MFKYIYNLFARCCPYWFQTPYKSVRYTRISFTEYDAPNAYSINYNLNRTSSDTRRYFQTNYRSIMY